MAEGGFKQILFAFVLVSLFSFLVLSAVASMAGSYNKPTDDVLGGSLSLDKFNSSLVGFSDTTEAYRKSFSKQNIFSALAGVVVTGIFDLANTMTTMILTPFYLIGGILTNVLHVPQIVTTVILSLLGLSIIFAIWALIKVGN